MLLHRRALQGEQQLGEALTFTLVSHLQEQLQSLVERRAERRQKDEHERERLAIEAEEARTRGTPVTLESFAAWRARFEEEMKQKKLRDEEDRLKGLTAKEREELKRQNMRPTGMSSPNSNKHRLSMNQYLNLPAGRRLFEQDRNLAASDATLAEEGATEVDLSQYDRSQTHEEEQDAGVLEFSDSD